jgi:hypothetical protein
LDRDERLRPGRSAPTAGRREDEDAHLLHRLQASAGNHAVTQLLAGRERGADRQRPAAPGTATATVQRNAKFDLAVGKAYDKADAPDALGVPAELKDGLEAAWAASFPDGKSLEQGGIMVKTKDGKYVWRAGKGTSGASFKPNYGDVGPDEVLVASGHTHPYDNSEGGHTDVAFSGGDLSNLVWQQERFKLVQSGTAQFGVAKTAEFDKLVAEADTAEKKLTLRKEMNALWDSTFKGEKGTFQERVKKASTTVCDKYHLVYYEGSGGTVSQPKAVPKVHVESPSPVIPQSAGSLPPVEKPSTTGTAPTQAPAQQGLLGRLWDWLGRFTS